MEYGYSCMGYEIAGGLGIKMADPSREVYVMVGDGSFLMMSSEIATSDSGRLQAQYRGARQPRIFEHRRALASHRLAGASAPTTAAERERPVGRRVRSGGFRRPLRRPGRAARYAPPLARSWSRRSRPCAATTAPPPWSSKWTKSSACPDTNPGGMCRSPKSPAQESVRQARAQYEQDVKRERRHEIAAGTIVAECEKEAYGHSPGWQRSLFMGNSGVRRSQGRTDSDSPACWMNWRQPDTREPNWAIGATCPPIPAVLRGELQSRGLVMLGAFVPVALKDPAAHAAGVEDALRRPACWRRSPPIPSLSSCWRTTTAPWRSVPATQDGSRAAMGLNARGVEHLRRLAPIS